MFLLFRLLFSFEPSSTDIFFTKLEALWANTSNVALPSDNGLFANFVIFPLDCFSFSKTVRNRLLNLEKKNRQMYMKPIII